MFVFLILDNSTIYPYRVIRYIVPKILHTPQSLSPQKHPPPEGQLNFVGVRQHHYAIQPVFTPPILFFLIIEDIGQKLTTKWEKTS